MHTTKMVELQIVVVRLLTLGLVVSMSVSAYLLLGPSVLAALAFSATFLVLLLAYNYALVRRRGLLCLLPARVRSLLLERSLLDIFRDLVYFPYVTRIIATFVSIATMKPHPATVPEMLKALPKEVGEVAMRKGLLSLAPAMLEELVLPEEGRALLPIHYGRSQEQWDRIEEYHREEAPVHEETWEQRVVHFLDSRFGWPSALLLIGVTLVGAYKMHPGRFKKMMVQNATFCGLVLSTMAVVVKMRRIQHGRRRAAAKVVELQLQRKEEGQRGDILN